jgi:hypothetical protein
MKLNLEKHDENSKGSSLRINVKEQFNNLKRLTLVLRIFRIESQMNLKN